MLIQVIYSTDDAERGSVEDLEGLAKDACDECLEILREPEKSQAQPAMKVLCSFMATTRTCTDPYCAERACIDPSFTAVVARFTLSKAVPHLVKLFLNPDEIANRAPTLKLLSDIIIAARDSMSKDPEVLLASEDVPLSPFKDEVLGVLTVGLTSASSASPALVGLRGMATTRGLLTEEELGFVVHKINELLQSEESENADIR